MLLGSAERTWPVPGCRCVVCTAAAGPDPLGSVPSGLRFADHLILDGPEPDPGADRTQPPAPLRVVTAGPGPLPPPGSRWTAGPLRVALLPGADPPGVVAVVAGPGQVLLWAARSGLPDVTVDALSGAELTTVVLSLLDPRGRPDPLALAHRLARLRRARALAPGCRVVAAGLSHGVAPLPRLRAELARWDVELRPDGAALPGGPRSAPPGTLGLPLRTLVLGGTASGKSEVAETLLAAEPEVGYVATGPAPDPDDPEWSARVTAHRARRPAWWQTLETADLAEMLGQPGPPLLVDSLGGWLTAALDRCGAWDDAPRWRQRYEQEVTRVAAAWRQAARPVVGVAEQVGSGVIPATASGRLFQDELGALTRRLATGSERVLLVTSGMVTDLDTGGAPW